MPISQLRDSDSDKKNMGRVQVTFTSSTDKVVIEQFHPKPQARAAKQSTCHTVSPAFCRVRVPNHVASKDRLDTYVFSGFYQETSKALTRTFLTTISSLRLMKHSVDNSPEMKWLLEKSTSQCEINCLVKVATNRRRTNGTSLTWKLLWAFC